MQVVKLLLRLKRQFCPDFLIHIYMECFVYVWSIESKMCIEYKNEHINEEQVVTGEVVVEVIMLWPEQPDTVSRALYVSFTHLLLIRNLIPGIIARQ